ncbi:nuclear transport factor 2 family protein [Aureibaculum conchae]|uniref:nuclear transport factor 2 family protein n=1 Tax=Aureibaculum sp. 2308TA14-22 TaxID=3108392 RepID=UPI003391654B
MKILKTVFLLGLAIVLFVACEKQEKRYTQQSPEIETVKKHIENYNSKNYDISVFADTSKTYFNSKDNPILSKDIIAYHKTNDVNYSSRGFTGEDPDYEMVITDDGDTWVNCWLNWKATLVGNGKEINIPIHLTYQFIDGKIVKELGYWDGTEVAMNLQAIEAAKNNSESE